MSSASTISTKPRIILGTTIVVLALLLLACGWVVPFKYESFSILYKFGMEKAYLRSGKIVGITTALLIFYQMLLASQLTIFEQVFSAKKLFFLHRLNGIAIAVLVIVHPLFIKASENFTPYTFAKKYYPEFLGIGVLCVLLALSIAAVLRNFYKLPYKKWLFQHRFGTILVLLVLPAHVLFVSETFEQGIPRKSAVIIFGLNLLLISRIWLHRIIK